MRTFKQFLESQHPLKAEMEALIQRQQQELDQAMASGDVNLYLKLVDKHKPEAEALRAKIQQARSDIQASLPPPEKRAVNNPPDLGVGGILRRPW